MRSVFKDPLNPLEVFMMVVYTDLGKFHHRYYIMSFKIKFSDPLNEEEVMINFAKYIAPK